MAIKFNDNRYHGKNTMIAVVDTMFYQKLKCEWGKYREIIIHYTIKLGDPIFSDKLNSSNTHNHEHHEWWLTLKLPAPGTNKVRTGLKCEPEKEKHIESTCKTCAKQDCKNACTIRKGDTHRRLNGQIGTGQLWQCELNFQSDLRQWISIPLPCLPRVTYPTYPKISLWATVLAAYFKHIQASQLIISSMNPQQKAPHKSNQLMIVGFLHQDFQHRIFLRTNHAQKETPQWGVSWKFNQGGCGKKNNFEPCVGDSHPGCLAES